MASHFALRLAPRLNRASQALTDSQQASKHSSIASKDLRSLNPTDAYESGTGLNLKGKPGDGDIARPDNQCIVVICGLPGVGKSHLAATLAKVVAAEHISSRQVRKQLNARRLYSFKDKLAIYFGMACAARKVLENGRSVVIDATFYHHTMRDLFKALALDTQTDIFFILVEAPERLVRSRLLGNPSKFGIYQKLKTQFEKVSEPCLSLWFETGNIGHMLFFARQYLDRKQ